MVLPIGFFMPLPLAMMIPFMGIQSSVMAKQFGENFQYGKRRISAMSNEEFNKLTPQKLQENANAELKAMIPSMEASIKEMSAFQTFLIGEFIKMIGDMLTAGLGKVLGISPDQVDDALQSIEHFLHGHGYPAHAGEQVTQPPGPIDPITGAGGAGPEPPHGDPITGAGGPGSTPIPEAPKVKIQKYVNVKVVKLSPPFITQTILKGDMTKSILYWYVLQYTNIFNGGHVRWNNEPYVSTLTERSNLKNSMKFLEQKYNDLWKNQSEYE